MAIAIKLKEELKGAVKRNRAEGLLLSGGLDSSILAYLSPDIKAFTVILEDYGTDKDYAEIVGARHAVPLHQYYKRRFSIGEALDTIPEVIRILKSFDPAIPNDLAIYLGLKWAKESGVRTVMTGDGADELFAGYPYMYRKDLKQYIPEIASRLSFSSNILGGYLDIEIKQPYLDEEFKKLALSIDPALKVRNEGGKTWGKWILRKAFEQELPTEIIWREKTAIEYGSGFTKVRQIIASRIPDKEYEEKSREYQIKFRGKEHLFYYEVFQREIGGIALPGEGERECPGCGAGVATALRHCRVCGGFPI